MISPLLSCHKSLLFNALAFTCACRQERGCALFGLMTLTLKEKSTYSATSAALICNIVGKPSP
jgi:hypothetical protein